MNPGASTINILVQGPVTLSDFVLCPERLRLTREYYVAVDVFRISVLALIDLDREEFHRAYEISEVYRVAVEIARNGLNRHLDDHRC